ncbi:MAG: Unknown protein [uncultured Sulfurovum sp.]|uniref:beta-lactamase n=1 Tax=uncultured Sulfurovum sp. TaxID=269237 RepID=A0A6S6U9G9_9BACT|nr:MAG: Unknown protein [uncultured Sulfurovum sp.]
MKKMILVLISMGLLHAGNVETNTTSNDSNRTSKNCDSVEVTGCFDSNFMSKLLTKVCNDGKMEACYNLGIMYAKGEGITENKPKAIALFKKACDGGIEDACENYNILTTCAE